MTAALLGLWLLLSGWDETRGSPPWSLSSKHWGAYSGVLMALACNPFRGDEFCKFIFVGYCEFVFIQTHTEINRILR